MSKNIRFFAEVLSVLLIIGGVSISEASHEENEDNPSATQIGNPLFDSEEARHKIKKFVQNSQGKFDHVIVQSKVNDERVKRTFLAVFNLVGYHHDDEALQSREVWATRLEVGGKTISGVTEGSRVSYTLRTKKVIAEDTLDTWTLVSKKYTYQRPGEDINVYVRTKPLYERLISEETKNIKKVRVCEREFQRLSQWQMKDRHYVVTYDIYQTFKKEWRRGIGSTQSHKVIEPYHVYDPIMTRVKVEEGEGPTCGDEKL